ncbi:MAG: hypothetical protein NTX52_02640, partial [Planctomycetota bacterium]|nr:hypothetical protein [Planctomycetota bacterium]
EVVQLPEHIKCVGTHEVTLKFADDLTAAVKVVVVPEPAEGGSDQGGLRPALRRTTGGEEGPPAKGEGEPNGT